MAGKMLEEMTEVLNATNPVKKSVGQSVIQVTGGGQVIGVENDVDKPQRRVRLFSRDLRSHRDW
jgi:hypothetical protein